eukprot:CAMPEP_0196572390 /NCGR_PEP_ID=MMETSP1081-20130531/2449_1 /TAXON_ID=36882 /ORGANISM="Pyramimonas amylifera, Strain CCMP720" /LENGTH=598 /DNA_ID=CAMNT_0041889699 /DNA_START=171 /DNA_END=1964 /DNA_ORIENTATION=-
MGKSETSRAYAKSLRPALLAKLKKTGKVSDQVNQDTIDVFFTNQDTLQDETKLAFQKYDADKSDNIDPEELFNLMEDLGMLDGLSEEEKKELCDETFNESDLNNDQVINLSEFAVMYKKLISQREVLESKGYKVPNIFGGPLEEAEELRVRAMKPMLERSIFAGRPKEAAGDYFDGASLRDKMFKSDWARIDKKPSFVQFKLKKGLALMDKESGKPKNTPLATFFKKALREDYDMLCHCYAYFCCASADSNFATMNLEEFKLMAHAAGIREAGPGDKGGGKSKGPGFIMDLDQLFQEINVKELNTSKKKKLEMELNVDDAFLRFEFMECIMQLALQFPKTDDVKIALTGYMMYIRNTLERECAVAALDRNVYRKDRLYEREVMGVFATYQAELRRIYCMAVGGDLHTMTQPEWLWLARDRLGFLDTHLILAAEAAAPKGGGAPTHKTSFLDERGLRLVFVWSQMLSADEIKGMEAYTTMSFLEFLEALMRCADAKDLPTRQQLKDFGFKSTLEVIEKNEFNASQRKPKPFVLPRVEEGPVFSTQKKHSAQERLEMMLDFIFLMMDPLCGSLLLGTLDRKSLKVAMEAECKELHGSVLW